MKIQEAVASVQNAPGSMYTREDVISLLNKLEVPSEGGSITAKQIEDLAARIAECIEENVEGLDSDAIDHGTLEFGLNGNEIILEGVELDSREIARAASSGIEELIEDFFTSESQ